ncbi:MAG: DUF167 domain-containing protein [Betaproteobacteria bacterium]|nr:DUF167 domain-containing protein [Betaproteobacteria bacterium]
MSWHRYDPARRHLILTLHVQPNARRNEVAGPHGDALKVRIAAPAVDNQANAALIEFLAERLGVPRSRIAIRHGTTGRRKIVEIAGGPETLGQLEKLARS